MSNFIVISLIKIHCTFYIFIYSILFIFTYIKIPLNYRGVTVRSQSWTVLTCPRAQKGDFCRTLHVLMMNEQKQIQHYLRTTEENSCDSAGGDIEVVLQYRIWWMCCSQCSSLQPHIIGLPFPTVTRRSTTLMLFDDTLIRMTVLSCYIGIISSPWSHRTLSLFPVRKETVMNLMQCQLLTSRILPGRQQRTCFTLSLLLTFVCACVSDNSVISIVHVWVILVVTVSGSRVNPLTVNHV